MTLEKNYNPAAVEQQSWAKWERHDAFHADPGSTSGGGEPYAIVIPPPNVTAALHLGHALNNTLQDVLTRWRRMCGDNAVWIPGTDHAGIATQTVVEKRLLAEEGKRRTDYQRDEFIKIVQAWKDEYEATITNQLKKMGCSCDWARQAFTMDELRAKAVREAFFRLFKDGLIYRGKRLVNWDPATQTALADDEVEMEEIDGHFWYMKYPLVRDGGTEGRRDGVEEYITVATTRPETMLGDTAVAVNPKDAARKHLIGRMVKLPIINRIIPIIGDDYVVIPNADSDDAKAKYASGFLKVTPAHDPNDYEIGQRHKLPVINVMGPDGTISDQHGWPEDDVKQGGDDLQNLLGMDRYEAREAIVEWFRRNKLLAEVKPYRHSVGHSYRSHVPIEPYLSDQWYVKVADDRLAGAALLSMAVDQRSEGMGCSWKHEGSFVDRIDSSRAGTLIGHNPEGRWQKQLRFIPERYAKTFQAWHENIRDWCISRQLWWGHRIPVWTVTIDMEFCEKNLPQTGLHDPTPESMVHGEIWQMLDKLELSDQVVEDTDCPEGLLRFCSRTESADRFFANLGAQVHMFNAKDQKFDADYVHLARAITKIEQDPDVLDTWFSSALWPMSTLGWPDETPELKAWNPTSTLSTAREIITLWVSRMVMFNIYFRGCVPFKDVYIHAMIQDGEGRKMSKSLGNGVDPLDIIAMYGADAMRFTLVSMATNTQDVRMPVERDPKTGLNTSPKFDFGRNFTNKLWNAGRFALENLAGGGGSSRLENMGFADRWILSRLARTVQRADESLANYQFAQYGQALYDFVWRDLCDWYLEAIKPVVRTTGSEGESARAVLVTCLDASMRLLHPVMPFITEAMWEYLNEVAPKRGVAGVTLESHELCIKARWPRVDAKLADDGVEQQFTQLQEIIGVIRNIRNQYNIPPRQKLTVKLRTTSQDAQKLEAGRALIVALGAVDVAAIGPEVVKPDDAAAAMLGGVEVIIEGLIDPAAERDRLGKRLAELRKNSVSLESRLSNPGYTDKAPAHLVQQTRSQLEDARKEIQSVEADLARLG